MIDPRVNCMTCLALSQQEIDDYCVGVAEDSVGMLHAAAMSTGAIFGLCDYDNEGRNGMIMPGRKPMTLVCSTVK